MLKKDTMHCLDTSAVLEMLYETEKGKEIESITKGGQIRITSLTIQELLIGMKEKEVKMLEAFFGEVLVTDFSKECATHSAVLERYLRKSGKLINKVDILIAGICFNHNYHLITCDRDFEKIKGLRITIL